MASRRAHLQSAFRSVTSSDGVPQLDVILALGHALQAARLRHFVDTSAFDRGAGGQYACRLLYAATRLHDPEMTAEDLDRADDRRYAEGVLAQIRENDSWGYVKDSIVKFAMKADVELEAWESPEYLSAENPKRTGGQTAELTVGDEVRAVGDPDPAGDFCLWLEGGIYYICGFGEEGRFPKLLGFADLQKLVRSPGKPVPWAELDPRIGAIGSRSTQPAMDVPAIKAVRAKLDRLLEEMDSAENEVDQAESRREYEELSAYLRAELAPGGLTRDLNSPIGRSRSMIFDRRNTVLKKLRSTKPPLTKLADHFEHHISSRFEGFVYRPQGTPPQWRTEKTQK